MEFKDETKAKEMVAKIMSTENMCSFLMTHILCYKYVKQKS